MNKPRMQHTERPDKHMKRNDKNIIKSATYAIMALFFGLAAPQLAAQAVVAAAAMVTEASGPVQRTGANAGPVGMLQELPSGARVTLGAGAKLVVVFSASGEEFAFTGPAAFTVGEREPRELSGAAPRKKALSFARAGGAKLNIAGVTQGAVVMRSVGAPSRLRAMAPRNGAVLEARPELRWEDPANVGNYRIALRDRDGAALHEGTASAANYRIPEDVVLKPGERYDWQAQPAASGGASRGAGGWFVVVDAAQRDALARARPDAKAPFSERVAFAAWLDREGYKDEARRAWEQLAREQPDEPAVRRMAEAASQ
jgi:hypothetical protein